MVEIDKLAAYYRNYGAVTYDDEPMYGEICGAIAESPDVLGLIASQKREAHQPNLILAAGHFLLLSGVDHPLAHVYARESDADVGEAFVDLILGHRDVVGELLATRHVQTNEVARCAVLNVGLQEIYQRAQRPLAWIDLGASAGLNLLIDRYRINYQRRARLVAATGPASSPLVIESELVGADVDVAASVPPVEWRIGIDRAPVDVTDDDQTRWLRANVWPSATVRAARLEAALAMAKVDPPQIIEADAAEGINTAIALAPPEAHLVVSTSWVWYYLDDPTRASVLESLRSAGRPITWLTLEGSGVIADLDQNSPVDTWAGSAYGLVTFDPASSSETIEELGITHPHGAWLNHH